MSTGQRDSTFKTCKQKQENRPRHYCSPVRRRRRPATASGTLRNGGLCAPGSSLRDILEETPLGSPWCIAASMEALESCFESQDHVYRGFRLLTAPTERGSKDGHVSKGVVNQGYNGCYKEVVGIVVDPPWTIPTTSL